MAGRAAAAGRRTTALTALHLMARLGRADRAEAVVETLGPFGDHTVAGLRAGHVRALARRDASALDDLAARFARLGMHPLAAESAEQAHRAWEDAGRHSAGRASRAQSRRHLAACPGTPLPGWAAAEDRAPDPEGTVLTVREREVAMLAATRMTNREIAARLTVSVRTIENHLYRVYGKLGITSRAVLDEHLGARSLVGHAVRSS